MKASPSTSRRARTRILHGITRLAIVVATSLLIPGTALALGGQSSSGSASAAQYTHATVSSSQLPFTGYLLIAVVPIALLLLSLGLLIRRLQARS